jgi:tetratricopeptide (TPR) repeat protein
LAGFDALTSAGRAFVANGDFRRARELLDRSRTASGEDFYSGMLLQFELDAATEDRASALQRIERLRQRRTEDFGVSCYVIGEGYKALGDFDRAIQWWTSAVERHETWTLTLMAARNRNHPVIGKDPRFLALLRRMGLEGQPGGRAR